MGVGPKIISQSSDFKTNKKITPPFLAIRRPIITPKWTF
jgi:hypothetical protein